MTAGIRFASRDVAIAIVKQDTGKLARGRSALQFAFLALAGFSLAGCGPANELGRQAVSGTVTLDGANLDEGTIAFDPADPSAGTSSGTTITDGKFEIPELRGLPPGTYRVRISAPDRSSGGGGSDDSGMPGESGQVWKERIPADWSSQSTQQVDVEADGDSVFTFDIKTSK